MDLVATGAGTAQQELQARSAAAASEANPVASERARLQALAAEAASLLKAVEARRGELNARVDTLGHLDAAFGRTGVQSYALEGILGELQVPAPACMPAVACMPSACFRHHAADSMQLAIAMQTQLRAGASCTARSPAAGVPALAAWPEDKLP